MTQETDNLESNQNINTMNMTEASTVKVPDRFTGVKSFSEKRTLEENANLKMIGKLNWVNLSHWCTVSKLSEKLKDIQLQYCQLKREKCERMGIEYEDPLDFSVPPKVEGDPALREQDMELTNQLSLHVLGPLFQNYEALVAQLQKEVAQTKFQLKTQLEDC